MFFQLAIKLTHFYSSDFNYIDTWFARYFLIA